MKESIMLVLRVLSIVLVSIAGIIATIGLAYLIVSSESVQKKMEEDRKLLHYLETECKMVKRIESETKVDFAWNISNGTYSPAFVSTDPINIYLCPDGNVYTR